MLVSIRPKLAPVTAVPDGIAMILSGVGIPTIVKSSFQNKYDPAAMGLAAVIM